jgi:hypothetical protein
VLQTDFHSDDKARDYEQLGRVVNVDYVRERQSQTLPNTVWEGVVRRDASEADWRAFDSTANRLMLDNLAPVLGNRMHVFLQSNGISKGPGPYSGHLDYVTPGWRDRVVKGPLVPDGVHAALSAEPPVERLYTKQINILHDSARHHGLALRGSALHWNVLPWLGVLFAALFTGLRRFSLPAVVAAIVLIRVPLVVLIAPLAQYKYYASVHLAGMIVAAVLVADYAPKLRAALSRPAGAEAASP